MQYYLGLKDNTGPKSGAQAQIADSMEEGMTRIEPNSTDKGMTQEEELEYLRSLKEGERVTETAGGMRGTVGTIVPSSHNPGSLSVRWDDSMVTSITHGTRRVSERRSE